MYGSIVVGKYASMPVFRYVILHVCKYLDQTLVYPKGETKGELECGLAQSNLFSVFLGGVMNVLSIKRS